MNPQNQIEKVKAMAEGIFAGLIAYNRDLEVFVRRHVATVEMTVRVNAADASRILGKGGAHFRAVKALVARAGQRAGIECVLTKMLPPARGEAETFPAYAFRPDWPRQSVEALLADACRAVFEYPVKISAVEAEGVCTFEIRVNPLEQADVVRDMGAALRPLFLSIGTTAGCLVQLDIFKGN